jgi:t-SNARE complex subunit (syntaxin)
VNEIFRDLATIVDKQQEEVDNIAEMTEKSHKSAAAGLEQVQKASKMQPGCLLQ